MTVGKHVWTVQARRRVLLRPRWARGEKARVLAFFQVTENQGSSFIRKAIRKRRLSLATLERWIHCALNDRELMRRERWRFAVIELLLECMPGTFPLLETVLNSYDLPFWYELQFTTLNWLFRSKFNRSQQRKILALVENNLMNARSEAGAAAWKAGDLLGDEWFGSDTVKILERVVVVAPYVAGRKGAIHGIAHALENADAATRRRLNALLRRIASEDRSSDVRWDANHTYEKGGCMRGRKRTHLSQFRAGLPQKNETKRR